jgi:HEPN domain-containing protein
MGMFYFTTGGRKGFEALALKLGLILWGHSLVEITNILSTKINIPEDLKDKAKLLDIYYIPSRYPNGFPSGKPADYFTQKQAKEAIDAADDIIRFCAGHLYK